MTAGRIRGSRRSAYKLLAVLLLALLLLGLDFLVRRSYLLLFKPLEDKSSPHRIAHDYYHHGFKPLTGGADHYGPLTGTVYVNSLGMRDAACSQVPPQAAIPRILLIGDSFTEGISVPHEKTFAGILQAWAQDQGVDVQNAGVSSYCPATESAKIRYLHEHDQVRFESLVLFVDISDVRDELFYERREDGSCIRLPAGPFQDRLAEGYFRYQKNREIKKWVEKNIENNFVLLGAIARNLWLFADAQLKLTDSPEAEKISSDLLEWPEFSDRHPELVAAGQARALASLDSIHKFCSERGIPMTLVAYPWPAQILQKDPQSSAKKIWKEWAQAKGVAYLSLFETFEDLGEPSKVVRQYYLQDDCHWNEAGHAEVAKVLIENWSKIRPAKKGPAI